MTAQRLTDLNVTTIRSVREEIVRGKSEIRNDSNSAYFFNPQIEGGRRRIQDSREVMILRRNFSIVDSTRPYLSDYLSDEWVQSSIRIPSTLRLKRGLAIALVEQNLEFISSVSERVPVIRRGKMGGEIPREHLTDLDLVNRYADVHG